MRIAPLLVIAMAIGGCTREKALIVGGTSLVLVGVGGYMNYNADWGCRGCTVEHSTADWAVPVGLGAAVLAATALAAHYLPSEDDPKPASGSPAPGG